MHRKICGDRKGDVGGVVGGVEDAQDDVKEENAECSEAGAVHIEELKDRAENIDDMESVVKNSCISRARRSE